MTKKQTNIILAIVILVVASFAYFFTDESSRVISFGDNQVAPAENVDIYEKEIALDPSIPSEVLDEETTPIITPESTVSVESTELNVNLYQVVKVVDGDTLDVNINGEVKRLRLIGIDTPETVDPRRGVQCFGKEASNKAKELLTGKSVALESDESQGEQDKYGRLLRYVIFPDGTNFNLYMISEGYAHEYTYDQAYRYQVEFKNAQIEAEKNQRGLWNPSTCSRDTD